MKLMLQLLAVALAATMQISRASLVTGTIGLTGDVFFDTSSAATATMVTQWSYTKEISDSGSFAAFVPSQSAVAFNTNNNWLFSTSTPFTNFWTVGGFRFELLSSSIYSQGGTPGMNGYIVVTGNGVVSGNGFTPTLCTWTFVAQDPIISSIPAPTWVFSASIVAQGTNGAPVLVSQTLAKATNAIVLSWSDPSFTLQSAPAPAGPFADVAGATSPYTNVATSSQRFFRLNQ